MADEILVKGQDGKWYILKGEEMMPYDAGTPDLGTQVRGSDLPKGVKEETYKRLEAKPQIQSTQTSQISAVRAVAPKLVVPISHEQHSLSKELDELIEEVMKKVGGMNDPMLQKRFRTIVSARLRDVRDANETRQMLMRSQKVGGMEMGGAETDRVAEPIERAFAEFQTKWKALEDKRIAEWKKKQAEEAGQKAAERVKNEEQAMEERYRRLTGGIAKSKSVVPVAAVPAPAVIVSKPALPLPVELILPPPPPPPPPPPVQKTADKRPQVEARPLVRPPPSGKVTDIRPASKLVGPVEEIGSLRLEDFRRLPGQSAPERAQKISEKIERLGRESLIRRSQGLEAWRHCPLNQLYGQILHTALQKRVSPQNVLTEWAGAGKTALTAEEFRAIMDLNQKLRF